MHKLAATMKGIPAIRPVSMADVQRPQSTQGAPAHWRPSGPMVDERAPHQQLGDMFAKSLKAPGGNAMKFGALKARQTFGL